MLSPSYILANNVVDRELVMETGWREMSPACPRCGSSNTKFCYYNNYSLTQPRYFCKGCRRYWTKGGSLRNVPVGGGCRKSRRSRSSSLRLITPPSNHRQNTTIYSNDDHHRQHHHHLGGHASYGSLNSMGEDSTNSPINSDVPTIDLAAVYANYLSQKPEIRSNEEVLANCGYNNNNPTLVELSNIPDATQIAPSSRVVLQEPTTFVHCNDTTTSKNRPTCPSDDNNNDHPSFSQTILPISELMSNIDHQNQVLYVTEFNRPILPQEISMQHEQLGLLPLPGEALMSQDHYNNHQQQQPMTPWSSTSLTEVDSNMQVPIRHHNHLQDLELDPHFSTMFNNGSWSPLDLQGFETTTSSSKP